MRSAVLWLLLYLDRRQAAPGLSELPNCWQIQLKFLRQIWVSLLLNNEDKDWWKISTMVLPVSYITETSVSNKCKQSCKITGR